MRILNAGLAIFTANRTLIRFPLYVTGNITGKLQIVKIPKLTNSQRQIMTDKQMDELFPEMTLNKNSRARKKCLVAYLRKKVTSARKSRSS